MKYFILLILLWGGLILPSYSKVNLLLSQSLAISISNKTSFNRLFHPIILKNETDIAVSFKNKKAHAAIIRKDILVQSLAHNHNIPYHIIGQLSTKSVLYFLAKDYKIHTIKDLQHTQVSVGRLGNKADIYFKHILRNHTISTNTIHFLSYDFYHSLSKLQKGEIDILFIFGNSFLKKRFKYYIKPYPKGFIETLKKDKNIYCTQTYCTIDYYLIVSDSIGKSVMHNIYKQASPLLSPQKELHTHLGQYYIDFVDYTKINQKEVYTPKDKKQTIKFGRAPWMDIAINEAIEGKGSTENILPMLDLSYKYIRFAKGNSGITTAPNDNKEGSWCAAYICWTLHQSGYKIHKKGRMASQSFRYFNHRLYKKIDIPIFGAITLYTNKYNPLHGHVGYLFGQTKTGNNILLGGNQNNRLKFSSYPSHGFGNMIFNGFYIPLAYKIQKKDKLSKKDIYSSASILNHRFGIKKSQQTHITK